MGRKWATSGTNTRVATIQGTRWGLINVSGKSQRAERAKRSEGWLENGGDDVASGRCGMACCGHAGGAIEEQCLNNNK